MSENPRLEELKEILGHGRCYPEYAEEILSYGRPLCYDDMTDDDIEFWHRWAKEKGLDK